MERNEELILRDTLNHLSQFTDGIVITDDASQDGSVEIAKAHPAVLEVVEVREWDEDKELSQTRNRQAALVAAQKYNPEWLFYADADERFVGDIRGFLKDTDVNGIRVGLYDAYLTPDDHEPYTGGELLNFRKWFGAERRDILMIWRNKPGVYFYSPIHRHARQPSFVKDTIINKFYCQHYGKSLSVEQWEENCEYYSKYGDFIADKWNKRRGKAIHTESDFGTPLYTWEQVINL